jgi:hypothetical protein
MQSFSVQRWTMSLCAQCTEIDNVTVCTVCRDGQCHCVHRVQKWAVPLNAQCAEMDSVTVCTEYRNGQCH